MDLSAPKLYFDCHLYLLVAKFFNYLPYWNGTDGIMNLTETEGVNNVWHSRVLILLSSQPGSFTTRSPQMPATHCPLQYIFIFYLFKYICYTRQSIIVLPLDWLYAHKYYDHFYMSFYTWSLTMHKFTWTRYPNIIYHITFLNTQNTYTLQYVTQVIYFNLRQ